MLQNVNVKTRVRKRKRKIVVRLILLQLVLLAFASHYARAKFWGIVKYYCIELFGVFCLVYILSCLKEKMPKNKKIVEYDKESNEDCEVSQQVVTPPIRTYNFNWVIKSENKEIKDTAVKTERVPYRSPFEETINTDKKILYKSPFEPLHKRVVLVLDSALDDFCYKLRYNNDSKVFIRKKERFKYRLRLLKNKSFIRRKERFQYVLKRYSNKIFAIKKQESKYVLRKYNDCKIVKKVCNKKENVNLCHFVPKKNYNVITNVSTNYNLVHDEKDKKEFVSRGIEYLDNKTEIINKEDKNDDELLTKAIQVVLDYERASATFLERKLNVGYLEALRLLDKMEEWGIVAKDEGKESRRVLTTKEEWLDLNT